MKNLKDVLELDEFDQEMINSEGRYDPYTRYQHKLYESILHSYDPEKLLQVLQKEYGEYTVRRFLDSPDSTDKLCELTFMCNKNDKDKILNDERFKHILYLFNYTCTQSKECNYNGHNYCLITLEPNIPEDYTKTVYRDWKGIVYHITSTDNLKGILQTGLRPKGTENQKKIYRIFDRRIFLTGGLDWESNVNKIAKDLDVDPKKVVILKIDLNKNKRKIRLFLDTIQKNGLGIYTKEQIDKECIIDYYTFE